jgi:hypothetical protein
MPEIVVDIPEIVYIDQDAGKFCGKTVRPFDLGFYPVMEKTTVITSRQFIVINLPHRSLV